MPQGSLLVACVNVWGGNYQACTQYKRQQTVVISVLFVESITSVFHWKLSRLKCWSNHLFNLPVINKDTPNVEMIFIGRHAKWKKIGWKCERQGAIERSMDKTSNLSTKMPQHFMFNEFITHHMEITTDYFKQCSVRGIIYLKLSLKRTYAIWLTTHRFKQCNDRAIKHLKLNL